MPKMMISGDYKEIGIRLERNEFEALYNKLGLRIYEYVRCCIQLALENPDLIEWYSKYHTKSIKDLAKEVLKVS